MPHMTTDTTRALLLRRVEALGRECAEEAIKAGGDDPTDCEGESLLPPDPIGGDWDALDELLADWCKDQRQQWMDAAFTDAYRERMREEVAQ